MIINLEKLTKSELISMIEENKEDRLNLSSCMLSILDSLKLYDKGSLELGDETLSQMMFRKMKGYDIDLNKELGFNHLNPVIEKIGRFYTDKEIQVLKEECYEDGVEDGQDMHL